MTAAPPLAQHFVIFGLNGLVLRILENLRDHEHSVAVVATGATTPYAAALKALGCTLVEGSAQDAEAITAAGVDRASCVAFVSDDDSDNLRAALAIAKRGVTQQIIVRLYNEQLGAHLAQLFDDCTILSEAALAAPYFAAAALGEPDGDRVSLAGHALLICRNTSGELEHFLPLRNGAGDHCELFPEHSEAGGDVLVDLGPFEETADLPRQPVLPSRHRTIRDRLWSGLSTFRLMLDHRIRLMAGVVVVLLAFEMIFFAETKNLSPLDALYFGVVTLTTVGYGDINLQADPVAVKVVGIACILLGAALIATLFTLLTDLIVGARVTQILGGVRGRLRNHVVVCGLGDLGARVALDLKELGAVVVIDSDPDNVNLAAARRAEIPVVIGDATRSETLHAAQVENADALVVATDDDVTDLQVAINARHLHPNVRVVLRLLDHELATTLEKRFGIHISRSSEVIAAPVFADTMMRRASSASVSVGGTTLLFTQLGTSAALAGRKVGELQKASDVRVLAAGPRDAMKWLPAADAVIGEGDQIAVTGRPSAIRALHR